MKSKPEAKMLKTHFTYSWWKYLIALIVGIFGVDLLYTVTEPQVPDSLKIEMIVCGASLDQDFNEYMERVRVNQMPDMLKTELSVIPDDDTAIQYLTVRIGTQGGDVYLLPKSEFDTIVSNGALLPLEDDAELLNILQDLNLESGWGVEANSRDIHLYGIPLKNQYGESQFSGLEQYFYVNDGYLCILRYGKNVENARKFLRILCREQMTDPAYLTGSKVSRVKMTVLGSTATPGFPDYINPLLWEQVSEDIRLDLSVRSDMNEVLKNVYDSRQDIYLIPEQYFVPLAQEGDFLSLENDELMMCLDPTELAGYWTISNQDGSSSLYGIPLSQLPGLSRYFTVDNGILCARASDNNIEKVLSVLRLICRVASSQVE